MQTLIAGMFVLLCNAEAVEAAYRPFKGDYVAPARRIRQGEKAYSREVNAFKEKDAENPPEKGQIVLIGSSSFTIWKNVNEYYPDYGILNRAFGGSTLLQVIDYIDDIVTPYEPRQVVIYCGENDLAGNPKLAAYEVYERFLVLFRRIRARLPEVPIAFVSMKPSPSRWHLRSKYIACNKWIADYCSTQPNATYVDVWNPMLDTEGHPKAEIFMQDQLHMNENGYKIWAPILKDALIPKA